MNKKVVWLIIGIVVFLLVSIAVYFLFFNKTGNVLSTLINGNNNEDTVNDNYNGIYVNSVSLNNTYYIFSQCSVDSIDYYIVVVNEDYYSYRSTCMGTYYLGEGNVTELSFNYNDNNYNVTKDDIVYYRDMQNRQIILNNNVEKKFGKDYLRLNNFNFMVNETQFKGNYYSLNAIPILGFPKEVKFSFLVTDNGSYNLFITNKQNTYYSFNGLSMNNIPLFIDIGNGYAIIEENIIDGKYSYNLKMLNQTGIIYSLDEKLPIVINQVRLLNYDNRLVVYDKQNKYFRMFISKNSSLCSNDIEGNNIAYYEFKIKYNYNQQTLSEPEFVDFGYESDGCSKINKYLEVVS